MVLSIAINGLQGSPYGVIVKVMDRRILVSMNFRCAITFTFRLIPLGKVFLGAHGPFKYRSI